MTLTELVAQVQRSAEAKNRELLDARENTAAAREAAAHERRALTDDPKYLAARKIERDTGMEAALLEDRLDVVRAELARDIAAGKLASEFHPGATQRGATSSTTTSSRDVYDAESDRTGRRSFFADLFNSQRGDVDAGNRMNASRLSHGPPPPAASPGLSCPST